MRLTFRIVFLLLTVFLLSYPLHGQTITELDSIPVYKPQKATKLYKFVDFGVKEIQYENISIGLTRDPSTTKIDGLVSTAFTSLTGLSSSSTKEGLWKVTGSIMCNDTLPEWSVYIFCEGYQQRDRERTRNSDGSWSMETNKVNHYYWDRNSSVVILEGQDTIGVFRIIMGIHPDELLGSWDGNIFRQQGQNQNGSSSNYEPSIPEKSTGGSYQIKGEFRSYNFSIVQNGKNRKVWIFKDDLLACMFQGDIDYKGVSKKTRNMPYILINKELPAGSRRDIFRLALMSRYVNNSLDKY